MPGTVTLHRVIAAPPERVFKAFVTPGENGFEYVESTKDQNSQGLEQIKGILK